MRPAQKRGDWNAEAAAAISMYDMRVKNRVSCTSETGRSSESTSELDPMRAVRGVAEPCGSALFCVAEVERNVLCITAKSYRSLYRAAGRYWLQYVQYRLLKTKSFVFDTAGTPPQRANERSAN